MGRQGASMIKAKTRTATALLTFGGIAKFQWDK
jgi:hypothetical protein